MSNIEGSRARAVADLAEGRILASVEIAAHRSACSAHSPQRKSSTGG